MATYYTKPQPSTETNQITEAMGLFTSEIEGLWNE